MSVKSPGVLLFIAPLFVSGYGVLRLFGLADGVYGPGLDWQAAHIVGLIGMVFFVPAVLGLGQLLGPGGLRTAAVTVTLVGLVTSIVQFGADIVFAAQAADKAGMSRLSHEFSDTPGVRLAFYTVGPPLFFLGLVVLTILLARAGRLPWWSPIVMTVSAVAPVLTLDLLPLAGLGILAAVVPLRRAGDESDSLARAFRDSAQL